MEFTEAQPGLFLGFNNHQTSTSSNPIQSVPLQLIDHKEEDEIRVEENGDDEHERFNLLGHSICLKRPRDGSGSAPNPNPSKCLAVEPGSVSGWLEARLEAVKSWGNKPLSVSDPKIHEILEREKHRQFKGVELVASENFVCRTVMEALGRQLTHMYSEGFPGPYTTPETTTLTRLKLSVGIGSWPHSAWGLWGRCSALLVHLREFRSLHGDFAPD